MPNDNRIVLSVTVESDGNYWIVRCPDLRMTAAHRHKAHAWMRGIRMFTSQILYAMNYDPTLSELLPPGPLLDRFRSLKKAQKATSISFETTQNGPRAEIPDLVCAAM